MPYEKLRSVRLTPANESLFHEYIRDNFADYFFFHVDYDQYPEDTEIYMALNNKDKIQAMFLNWKDRRLQLRGSINGLEFLLKDRIYTPISVTGFEIHKKLIAHFFPECKKEIALFRMEMKKGEQKDFEKYNYEILSETHRERIVSFMRSADPIFWGSRVLEDIIIDENNQWFGIVKNGELLCIMGLWKYQTIGYITVVGTHVDHRNMGLASSLVSSVLKKLFRDKERCFITVRIENSPAVYAYKKLGFSICNTHYSYERE